MWGLIPAAGRGTHIQPLAVAGFLVDRLIAGGATKLCFVINSNESDILEYFGGSIQGIPICYVVQPRPAGVCDAIFRALPLIFPDEPVAIGLPDTIWFPERALAKLPSDDLSLLLFSVQHSWILGACKMPGGIMTELFQLWCDRDRRDERFGTLVNAYLASGGCARAFPIGTDSVDVGTLGGWRHPPHADVR